MAGEGAVSRLHYAQSSHKGFTALNRDSLDAVGFLSVESTIGAVELARGDSVPDVLRNTIQPRFARLKWIQIALIPAAPMHATAVKLANRKVFRHVLDNLIFDPAPKAFQRTSTV